MEAGRGPRQYELAINALAWSVGSGPLFQQDLWHELEQKGVQGYVALAGPEPTFKVECDRVVEQTDLNSYRTVGYMQLLVAARFVVIQHLAVERHDQRRGVGRELIATARSWLDERRKLLFCDVSEDRIDAQLFLSAVGFIGRVKDERTFRFEVAV